MRRMITVLAAACLTMTACKKDRTCNCTVPANGSVPAQTFKVVLKDSKKRSAKNSCQISHDYYQLSGGSCELVK